MSPKKKFNSALLRINGKVVKHAWVNTEHCSDETSDDYSDISSDVYSDISSDDCSDESADEDECAITYELREFGKQVFKAADEWKIRKVELMIELYGKFDRLCKLTTEVEDKEEEFADETGMYFDEFQELMKYYCKNYNEVMLCDEMIAESAQVIMELEAAKRKFEEEASSDVEEVNFDLEEAMSDEDEIKSDAGDKKSEEEESEYKKEDGDSKAEDLEPEAEDEQPKNPDKKLELEDTEPEDEEPSTNQQKSKTDVRKYKAEPINPETEVQKPKTEMSKPKIEVSKPKTDVSKPKIEMSKPKIEVPKSKTEAPKTKIEATKPKTKVNKKSTKKSKSSKKKRKSNIKDQDPSILVSIGPNNTKVPECVLNNIDWSQPTAATRKLLMTIFDRETLAFHTLTGKPSPAFLECNRPTKDQLNPKKVADIIHIVTKRSNVHEKDVRGAITTKCADENKMFKQREKRKLSLDENKENSLPKSNPRGAGKSKNSK